MTPELKSLHSTHVQERVRLVAMLLALTTGVLLVGHLWEQALTREHLHHDLEILLDELNGREATVIRQRFGLEDNHPRTLSEIGENLHLSRERVRQIESRALLKLRQPQNRSRVRDYLVSLDER